MGNQRRHGRPPVNNRSFRSMFREFSELCKQYGYSCTYRFGEIHIFTRWEEWYFRPQPTGPIRLMHGNKVGAGNQNYHEHFRRAMTYSDLLIYVNEHERAKYGNEYVDFTFTKDGKPKKRREPEAVEAAV